MKSIPYYYTRFHFESLLRDYAMTYHPLLVDDKLFVCNRVREAYELYRELIVQRVAWYAAYELAVMVLMDEG